MSSLSFDQDRARHLLPSSAASLTPRQEKLMKEVMQILHEKFPQLNPLVLRGFFRLSVKEWVKETGKTAADLIDVPVAEAEPDMRRIFKILESKLSRILRNRDDVYLLQKELENAVTYLIERRKQLEAGKTK